WRSGCVDGATTLPRTATPTPAAREDMPGPPGSPSSPHRVSQAPGPHVGPVLFDIGQAVFLAGRPMDRPPARRDLLARRPKRVLLLVIDQHPKDLAVDGDVVDAPRPRLCLAHRATPSVWRGNLWPWPAADNTPVVDIGIN